MPTSLMLADQVCLALVGEAPTHGWALVKLLAPGGDIGKIWSLSRPLTYRAIDRLVDADMITRSEVEADRRSRLNITPSGRRARNRWLDEPVEHLRDLRTEFLLKLELLHRCGLDHTGLVERQQTLLEPAIEALSKRPPATPADLWRQESARSASRFLERIDTLSG